MQQKAEEPNVEPTKMGSGSVASGPAPRFGRMRNGRIVEPDDDEYPTCLDGYEELRRDLDLREHG